MKKSEMRSHRFLLAALILLYVVVYTLTGVALSLLDAPGTGIGRGRYKQRDRAGYAVT